MKLEPIAGEPALLLKGKHRTLIVADFHMGIEAELRELGINIPSQTEKLADHLFQLCKEHEVDNVIIVGDVKHNVPLTSRQEYFEIPKIFENLKDNVSEVHITMGNHDGNLKNVLPKWVNVHGTKGFVFKKIGFFHGHSWPDKEVMKAKQVVMAHEHPTIQFVETLGERDSRQCWVKAQFIQDSLQDRYPESNPELVIVPTFNPLCGGIALNTEDKLLGPIMKNDLVDMDNSEIYLLNGTFLGKLKDLRVLNEP
jgi:putative SbcD/Mre11-related phosphoesterase